MSPRTPECCFPLPVSALAFVLAVLASACGPSSQITTGPTLVKCEVSLSASSNLIAADGGSATITVATNPECVWTASSQASWISGLTPPSGQGNGSISFNVSPNASTAPREGQIAVNDAQLRVQQQPTPCQFTVSPAEQTIAATGGSASLTVTTQTGCAWNASADQAWITIDSGASGSGNGVVRFTASQNTQAARTGAVTVAGQKGIVEQSGPPLPPDCVFTLSSPGVLVPAAGAAGTVTLQTRNGCSWSATSTVAWVGITAGGAGNAEGVVSFVVSPNTAAARVGTLRIANQTFTISQTGVATCAFSIAPTNQSIGAGGGTGSPVAVTTDAGCTWSASSQTPWITITSGASGNGPGQTQFTVEANSGAARTGTLTIAGHTFTVTQAAAATCAFSISPTTQSIGAAGGPGSPVTITTTSGCAWTATSNHSWIAITPPTSGSGPGTVQFSIAANTGSARTGTLSIAGHTFTVTQAAAVSCSYSINPNNQSIGAGGGAGTTVAITTNSGCPWTAISNVPWITVTSGASGSGPGTTQFSVGANTGGSRTGTLTIAGETFTVTQAAAPTCTYTLSPTSETIDAAGEIEDVRVTTQNGCVWTATSNVSWIEITLVVTGVGNGQVVYRVERNRSENSRTGTLTIAGLTFTVTQRGEDE